MRRLHRNPGAAPAAARGKTRPAGRRRDGRPHPNAGAALIVALSIMAVLLAVGLTFFAVTRIESTTAVNVVHTVRAQYLVDAGFAVAQYTLNRDLQVNPNATSTDHAWRTLFNGAAFAGKEWTWVDGIPPWAGGRTVFTLEPLERALRDAGLLSGGVLYAQFYRGDGDAATPTPDGPREPLFRGPRTAPWLAVPRWSGQTILLYATAGDLRLVDAAGTRLTLTDINNALTAAGLPQRFERFDMTKNALFPFVTPDFAGQVIVERPDGSTFLPFAPPPGGGFFPANFVNLWADFDSDGDGLRDSVWIPLPKDVDLSRDGVDNDLDGYPDNQFFDPAVAAQGLDATDEGEIRRHFELGAFVYAVDAAGAVLRDQDAPPAAYRLTLPLPALSVPVDMDRDGEITPADRVLNTATATLEYVYLTLPDQIRAPRVDPDGLPLPPVILNISNVDTVDNDYDLHVNGFTAYAALAPPKNATDPCPIASGILSDKGLRPINLDAVAPGFTVSAHAGLVRGADGCSPIVLGVSAESVCEVIGRMAVHIADESGKANLNAGGLHTYGHQNVLESGGLTPAERAVRATRVVRGMNQALSPVEYETRILPAMGIERSPEAWNMLMGAGVRVGDPEKNLWDFEVPVSPQGSATPPGPYDYDVTAPGYGRADDNANSFLLAFSRRDENASGLPDSGLYLPRLSAYTLDQLSNTPSGSVLQNDELALSGMAGYYRALGLLEGIDDPAEFLQRAPLRNRLAESDTVDNNNNGTADELGEWGDRTLAVHYELQKMADAGPSPIFGPGRWPDINRFITANSESRNVAYISTPFGDRAVNKLDPNFADAPQLAAALLLRGQFPNAARAAAGAGVDATVRSFAFGLRQSNKTLRGALLGGPTLTTTALFPADAQLQALQTAVNVADHRDRDAVRSLLVMEKRGSAPLANEPAEPLNERERVRQQDLFPAGAIQEYFSDSFGITPEFNDITAVDPWWAALTDPNISDPTDIGQQRLLSYAAAGAEAIRITEIMPRPVRRVEAEILPLAGQATYQIDPLNLAPVLSANWTAANIPAFNLNPAPYAEMPVFDMARVASRTLPTVAHQDPGDPNTPYVATFTPRTNWTLYSVYGEPVLGPQTGWSYFADPTDPEVATWSAGSEDDRSNTDIIEFSFRPTAGLPPGRYYLTVNLTEHAADGTVVTSITDANVLQYAVKYMRTVVDTANEPYVAGTFPADFEQTLYNTVSGDIQGLFQGNTNAWVAGLDPALPAPTPADLYQQAAPFMNTNVFDVYWRTLEDAAYISDNLVGSPRGWAFLPVALEPAEQAAFDALPNKNNYWRDAIRMDGADSPAAGLRTFTIIVPGYDDTVGGTPPTVTPLNTVCVALRVRPAPEYVNRRIAVNFFDFSQEPDHEYVEIANTTDQELDLSGWTLEVGIPDPAGLDTNPEMRDPFKSVWEVPANTSIAAKGRLLLSFTDQGVSAANPAKAQSVDSYRTTGDPNPMPGANGIGLTALLGGSNTEYVTVPPIADTSASGVYGDLQDIDGTGSVFTRATVDYIDNDGDGVSSQNRYYADNATIADTDRVLEEIRTHDDIISPGVVPAFARIVPLVNRRLWEDAPYTDAAKPVSLAEIDSVEKVAQLVLRGGVLPNYPERDGFDNDGDGGYLANDSTTAYPSADGAVLRRYIRGTLDKDMVDNDYNGLVDENGADYFNGATWEHANPFLSEGVDEGNAPVTYANQRPRVHGPGSFEAGTFGIGYTPAVGSYINNWLNGAAYAGSEAVRQGYDFSLGGAYDNYALPGVTPFGVAPADSPEWAAFVERRWNPGDNVIVTLYVGDSAFGRVADQATYREYDVINRTVDDIVESPYAVDGYNNHDATGAWVAPDGTDLRTNPRNRVALGPDRLSYWAPDQMGLDFYRALERKHPLYSGDRFGTSNRWEPTDGAYDDWADSPAWYEQAYNRDGGGSIEPRFGPDVIYSATPKEHVARLFGHALAGSPLRMNLTERLWENPPDLAARFFNGSGPEDTAPMQAMRRWDADSPLKNPTGKGRQFLENDEVVFPGDTGVYVNHAHAFRRSGTGNVPYATLADLMRVPMPLFEHSLDTNFRIPSAYVNVRYQPVDDTRLPHTPPGNAAGALWRQDLSVRAAVLGNAAPLTPHRAQPMRARMAGLGDLTELSALDPVVLTVGQAGFAPLWPNPANDQAGLFGTAGSPDDLSQTYAQWQDDSNPATPDVPPFYWSPVYLFADGNEASFAYSPFPVFGAVVGGVTRYTGVPTRLTDPSGGVWRWPVVLNQDFLLDTARPAPVFGTMNPAEVEGRWPTARRAVMFVSKHDTAVGEANRPEMVLTWDAEDGLVNGTYIAYVGTFVPGMYDQLDRLQNYVTGLSADGAEALLGNASAPVLTEPPLPLVADGAGNLVLEPRLAGLMQLDVNRDAGTGDRFDPLLALEFVTDRTTASRVAPRQATLPAAVTPEARAALQARALAHPADWYPPDPAAGGVPSGVAYRADGDGMILYSHDASMAWRPRLVRVTDNFLALRVRNLGRPDQVACITCVVLTPAPRTVGRLNVNTAETGQYVKGTTPYLFNPLLGLPGIVKAYDTMAGVTQTGAPRALDALDLPTLADFLAFGPPLGYTPNPALGNPLLHQLDPDPNADSAWNALDEGLASLRLLSLLVSQRPHHPDGRYFTALASLAAGAGEDGILGNESGIPVRPLSNYRHAEDRYNEVYQRFAGLANLVETRSDMFEILVTVQEGNLSDLDGDGRLDYRGRMNSEEFVKTAESAGRAIYERRARKDASEEARGVR